jgi:molecular chaperone DnaK (HSP70)
LGGGTFDVSLLTIENGVFEVVATNGDTHLGGEDFDQRVIQHYVKLYKKKRNCDITKNQRAIQKLRREIEKAKRALSTQHQTRIEIESLIDGEDFGETLTRARFEELNLDLFKSTMIPVQKVLDDAGMKAEEVDEIVLVGGSTRIPKVQELVRQMFKNKEPVKGINPDEAVAYGAAVQAGIIGGESQTKGIILLDVCPLSLGHIVEGGLMDKMIPRNSVIPTKKVKMYTTVHDNQHTIEVEVMEGERPMGADNHKLGKFEITGIAPARAGIPQIEVTFEVDNNGVLHVSAKDMARGKTESITINNDQNRLSQEEIKKMVEDSQKFAKMDKKIKEQAEAKLQLERTAYNLRTDLDEAENKLNTKLTTEEKETLRTAINAAIKFADDSQYSSTAEIRAQTTKLNAMVRQLTSKYIKDEEKKKQGRTEL